MFQLPKEIQIYIFEYNAEHRELFNDVLSELLDYVNYATCDKELKYVHILFRTLS